MVAGLEPFTVMTKYFGQWIQWKYLGKHKCSFVVFTFRLSNLLYFYHCWKDQERFWYFNKYLETCHLNTVYSIISITSAIVIYECNPQRWNLSWCHLVCGFQNQQENDMSFQGCFFWKWHTCRNDIRTTTGVGKLCQSLWFFV